jgi:hypothetical protein
MTITKLIEKTNVELNTKLTLSELCNDYTKFGYIPLNHFCGSYSKTKVQNCEQAIHDYIKELYVYENMEKTYTLWMQNDENEASIMKVKSINEGEQFLNLFKQTETIIAYEINPNF